MFTHGIRRDGEHVVLHNQLGTLADGLAALPLNRHIHTQGGALVLQPVVAELERDLKAVQLPMEAKRDL